MIASQYVHKIRAANVMSQDGEELMGQYSYLRIGVKGDCCFVSGLPDPNNPTETILIKALLGQKLRHIPD